MIGAIGTTLLFACNAIFANRSAKRLGSNHANFARLAVAVLILGAWAHFAGQGLGGASFSWFFISGIAGFGVGGVAMFQALPRLGSPLAMLIVQCASAVVAASIEWGWLGTRLTPAQLAFIAVTLLGVALGLMPRGLPNVPAATLRAGIAWAFLSAAGQGFGAVLSRKAFSVARLAGEIVDPPTSAYQRALAGLCVAAVAVALVHLFRRRHGSSVGASLADALGRRRAVLLRKPDNPASGNPALKHGGVADRAWPWVLANALCGPVLGVTCFQWALSTTPAGIVQPIVATAPLVTIPLAIWLEQMRPRPLYYVGTVVAVVGVAGLFVFR